MLEAAGHGPSRWSPRGEEIRQPYGWHISQCSPNNDSTPPKLSEVSAEFRCVNARARPQQQGPVRAEPALEPAWTEAARIGSSCADVGWKVPPHVPSSGFPVASSDLASGRLLPGPSSVLRELVNACPLFRAKSSSRQPLSRRLAELPGNLTNGHIVAPGFSRS